MAKKVGIITILKTNNYGAELQAYALQEKLKQIGYDAEIIDYLYYKNRNHKRERLSKPIINIGFIRRIKETLYPTFSLIKKFLYYRSYKLRKTKFDDFHLKNTSLSKTYYSLSELYKENFNYDIYMVGSDQVWNPFTGSSIEPYLLSFAPRESVKVSYASSFGVSKLPDEAKEIYKKHLSLFNYISVREDSGINIIKELIGNSPTHVLDPTMLLSKNEWKNIASSQIGTMSFILLYILSPSTYIEQLALYISKITGYKILRICKEAYKESKSTEITDIINAGPAEFIGLFMESSFVITNSFHGTAFSINFNKPFYTVIPNNKINNSRQESILNLLNLNSRILKEGTEFKDRIELRCDFSNSNIILEDQRAKSIKFLKDSLK